jgi:hypothetical protein
MYRKKITTNHHNALQTLSNIQLSANCLDVDVEVEVNLRLTVSRPVCPGVRRPSGTCDQFFFLLEISFRQLLVCYFVVPSLTRGDGSVIYCTIASGPGSHSWVEVLQNSRPYFTVSSEIPPKLEGQVPVFISPRKRVAQLYPRALGYIFVASYGSQGSGGGILTRLHTGLLRCMFVPTYLTVFTAVKTKQHKQTTNELDN